MQAVEGASGRSANLQAHFETKAGVVPQSGCNEPQLFGSRADISSQPRRDLSYSSYKMALDVLTSRDFLRNHHMPA
ncbi:hypothetical protein DPV78_003944 [Talaromyces pinophilus]|nr:hypothetical protein DPV78_003944 [Talaromyces pinophilus]